MPLSGLLDYISSSSPLKSPTLLHEKTHTDETGTYLIYKCVENEKYYFSHISKEHIIHSELDQQAIENFGLK